MLPFVQIRMDGFFSHMTGEADFPSHLHNEIEILMPVEGTMCMEVDNTEYEVQPGQAMFVFPNRIHSYSARCRCNALMLIFPTHLVPAMGFDWETTEPVCPLLEALPPEALYARDRLIDFLPAQQINRRLQAMLHLLLVYLVHHMELRPIDRSTTPDVLYRSLVFLSQHYSQDISLKMVAKAVGVNDTYLSHLFGVHLKMDFRHYLNVLRLDKARILLTHTDLPVETVAIKSGYNCLRSFDRSFQRAHNCTPRTYRKENRQTGWAPSGSLLLYSDAHQT